MPQKLLLDTHIWLWSLLEPHRLSAKVARALAIGTNELWISPISSWEIMMLCDKKRLSLAPDAAKWITAATPQSAMPGSAAHSRSRGGHQPGAAAPPSPGRLLPCGHRSGVQANPGHRGRKYPERFWFLYIGQQIGAVAMSTSVGVPIVCTELDSIQYRSSTRASCTDPSSAPARAE